MPVPGVERNPDGVTRFNRFRERRQVFVARPGNSPGLMDIDTRVDTAAAGTVRRLWEQAVTMIPAPPPFPVAAAPTTITRALRYRASSLFRRAGNDNTRFGARRPIIPPRHHSRPVTIAAGNQQGRPTRRNRMTSFGSRVPTVNQPSPAATKADQ